MNHYEGGCACGAIRYEVRAESKFSFHCQCRQCQRITGSGHASQFMLPKDVASLRGELTYYEQRADNGNSVSSGFCPTCGSPILKKSSGYPEMLFFHAASLDDPRLFKPQKIVWSASKQPWDYVDPNLVTL
jgi:hypothetical protein